MPIPSKQHYRGRFAPSPTGPLHFGSLVAAVASYVDAKHHSGDWLIRIDDIDHQRCKPEYSKQILETLEIFGFEWDEEIVYQQQQCSIYDDVIKTLESSNLIYQCICSRKILPSGAYPGTCRSKNIRIGNNSKRIKTTQDEIVINDCIQPDFKQNLSTDIGDFVIYRADGMHSYHLATVVDDHAANITHIIRGADLLDSTPRQIYLQNTLNFITPLYGHIPIAVNQQGEKLSKQTYAKAIDSSNIQQELINALEFLGHKMPVDLKTEMPKTILDWAIHHWDIELIPKNYSIPY